MRYGVRGVGFVVGMIVVLLTASCQMTTVYAQSYSGLVFNTSNGQPVPKFEVLVNHQSVFTGADGKYSFTLVDDRAPEFLFKITDQQWILIKTPNPQVNLGLVNETMLNSFIQSNGMFQLKIILKNKTVPVENARVSVFSLSTGSVVTQAEMGYGQNGILLLPQMPIAPEMAVWIETGDKVMVRRLQNVAPHRQVLVNLDLNQLIYQNLGNTQLVYVKEDGGITFLPMSYQPNMQLSLDTGIVPHQLKAIDHGVFSYLNDDQPEMAPQKLIQRVQISQTAVELDVSGNIYNLAEIVYVSKSGKTLKVYCDLPQIRFDAAAYDKDLVLQSVKLLNLPNQKLSNFDLLAPGRVRDYVIPGDSHE